MIGPGLGCQLRAARLRAGIGLREAARNIGITPSYLVLIERGDRCPSRPVAVAIITVYCLDVDGDAAAQLLVAADRVPAARRARRVSAKHHAEAGELTPK